MERSVPRSTSIQAAPAICQVLPRHPQPALLNAGVTFSEKPSQVQPTQARCLSPRNPHILPLAVTHRPPWVVRSAPYAPGASPGPSVEQAPDTAPTEPVQREQLA